MTWGTTCTSSPLDSFTYWGKRIAHTLGLQNRLQTNEMIVHLYSVDMCGLNHKGH